MYIKTLIFAAITLVFTSFPAFAATPQVHQLRTMTSAPGQSKVAFLVDVAHWMRAWTDDHGFEACGMIVKRGDAYSVTAYTFGSHVGCRFPKTFRSGWTSTSETIHSHPRHGGRYTNAADCTLSGLPVDTKVWNTTPQSAENNFSPKDYRSGFSGYLVGTDGLYYQHGRGTQTRVASLSNP